LGELRRSSLLVALLIATPMIVAQSTALPLGLVRIEGQDAPSKITYVRFALDGKLLDEHGVALAVVQEVAPPRLIAQCTQNPAGKLAFEPLADFGGVDDLAYHPPWDHLRDGGLFPPPWEKVSVTMEFFGYAHVKPVKRQWEVLLQPAGQPASL
jgi:hypothetical protein